MKVILLRDVKNVGRKYEVKEVNNGFANNFLINSKSALPATPANLGRLKAEMEKTEKAMTIRREVIEKGLSGLNGLIIKMAGKASAEGHLFASIGKQAILAEIEKISNTKIEPNWLDLPHALKTIGEHKLTIEAEDHKTVINVVIENIS